MPNEKKAQTTFEYILLVAAVVVILLIFLNPNGPFRNSLERMVGNTADQIDGMVNAINMQ